VLDNDGYAVFNREVQRKPIISEAVAYQMVSMLADVVDVGTGAASISGRAPPPGANRMTDDFKDAWFVGFSSTLVAGVWVGFDKPATIGPDGYGARYALPIWADFSPKLRASASRRIPRSDDGGERASVRVSHMIPRETCPMYTETSAGDAVPEDK
jgi:penicillin-binding protein 1A